MHRWSQLFIPTLREAPADAEVASHKFLVRSGYVRQLAAGIYSYLFLGQRSFNKITAIVREEMDRIGQEFYLPALHPRELWEVSGRWSVMGENLFRLKDRKGAELCLAMTHEENMTEIARKELRSYKQLPQIWYQIQTKFRDEPRPKAGLLRVLDKIGKEIMPIMGCYGIGIERILTAAIEQSNDENGFSLPRSIAPFDVVITPTNVSDEKLKATAEDIAKRLESAGHDVLLDDRDERPGVKFKDADLVGIPFRVNVGKKVTEDRVEVVQRSTRQSQDVSIAAIVEYFQGVLEQAHK
jgi:prolyl-tRNA synthetase